MVTQNQLTANRINVVITKTNVVKVMVAAVRRISLLLSQWHSHQGLDCWATSMASAFAGPSMAPARFPAYAFRAEYRAKRGGPWGLAMPGMSR